LTEQQATELWKDLYFIAFPQTREWLAETTQSNATFDMWVRVIKNCDFDDVFTVMNDMIDGKREKPKAYERDETPQLIRQQANEIRSERNEKATTARKYFGQSKGSWAKMLSWNTGQLACSFGRMVREKQLTPEQNAERLEQLFQVERKQIDPPDWYVSMTGIKDENSSPFHAA
jgi:hypothetical protein